MLFKELAHINTTNTAKSISSAGLLKRLSCFLNSIINIHTFAFSNVLITAILISFMSVLLLAFLIHSAKDVITVFKYLKNFLSFLALISILKRVILMIILITEAYGLPLDFANFLMIFLMIENLLFALLSIASNYCFSLEEDNEVKFKSFCNFSTFIPFILNLLLVLVSYRNTFITEICILPFLAITWYYPYRLRRFLNSNKK